ncbi:MAG: 16S rRNA (adenine(1518)-N(6)/adenine(1519)-N(6))-dimethyltransferase RsmA [Wenzhouxiangella sp.]|jgi:16S rRNA (adenine1518-N6/adenine1519-N6)-dimethyltransferase|nr:16S rRNA (adenine(1518)-N(6)/adenine(1519)-N(6))-dimethyltransferase RsmA [Wenzhouxiangella sp.]
MQPHRPRKRFGQHFLIDERTIDRLVAAVAVRPGERLLEIGPGEGVLTRPLLIAGGQVTAIELDRDLASTLPRRLGEPAGLTVIQGDVLKADLAAIGGGRPLRVVGNLPYNISTPILFRLFDQLRLITDMHFMLQKEVVDRMVAAPGGRDYGRLSVMAGFFCEMEWLFDVPASAFRPPPKVVSAIIRLKPKALNVDDLALLPNLDRLVRQAFSQRRKTLRNALKGLLDADQIRAVDVDPGLRPEKLSLNDYLRLAATTE